MPWLLLAAVVLSPAVPAVAQTIEQHCQVVTTCETTKTTFLGFTISEKTSCREDVICHYHV